MKKCEHPSGPNVSLWKSQNQDVPLIYGAHGLKNILVFALQLPTKADLEARNADGFVAKLSGGNRNILSQNLQSTFNRKNTGFERFLRFKTVWVKVKCKFALGSMYLLWKYKVFCKNMSDIDDFFLENRTTSMCGLKLFLKKIYFSFWMQNKCLFTEMGQSNTFPTWLNLRKNF